jgi:protein-S-isoprenylcysteine O-methyltransferase Ste14
MTAMAGSTLAMATIQGTPWQTPATYRATRLDRLPALLWTVLQVIIFWGTFLVILPKGIQEVEQQMSWPHFHFPGQFFVASTSIVLASILGLASGISMAMYGKGTPLPTASAAELVCSGPYRWVRNPMAVAGITQGLGVGLLLGSYGVLVYALLGAVFWHLLVRPSEEHDLHLRFGSDYDDYRRRTGLWIPGWFIDARSKQL